MTSGIDWPEPNSIGPLTGALLFGAYNSAAFAASFPQALPPGQFWNYSTANYNLLQYILRSAAQKQYLVKGVGWEKPTFPSKAIACPCSQLYEVLLLSIVEGTKSQYKYEPNLWCISTGSHSQMTLTIGVMPRMSSSRK